MVDTICRIFSFIINLIMRALQVSDDSTIWGRLVRYSTALFMIMCLAGMSLTIVESFTRKFKSANIKSNTTKSDKVVEKDKTSEDDKEK